MKHVLVSTIIAGSLLIPTTARAQVAPPAADVFAAAALPNKLPRTLVAGAEPVSVDLDLLAGIQPGAVLRFATQTRELIGTVNRINVRGERQRSIFGRLENEPDSFFILVLEQDAVAGLFQSAQHGNVFKLSYVADGVHEFGPAEQKTNDCASAPAAGNAPRDPEAPPEIPVAGPDGSSDGGISGVCSAPPRHFDVMVYYTPGARDEAGGTSAIRSECQLAVDTTNQTYDDSQINPEMVLIFRGEINYAETNDVFTDRDRLQNTSDGHMDGVHAERNTYGADFVVLMVDNSDPDWCGGAFCTPPDSSWAFAVVQRGCASGNFTFPHEVGHLQGAAHNLADAGSDCNEYCYSFGRRYFGNSGQGWRTVMAYNNTNGDYTRIGIWSNPNVMFDGVATGFNCSGDTEGAYNAATLNNTAANRESWRNPKFEVWVELNAPIFWRGTYDDPWPSVANGVGAIYSGAASPLIQPNLWIKSATYAEALTIDKRMTVNACGGAVRIGG